MSFSKSLKKSPSARWRWGLVLLTALTIAVGGCANIDKGPATLPPGEPLEIPEITTLVRVGTASELAAWVETLEYSSSAAEGFFERLLGYAEAEPGGVDLAFGFSPPGVSDLIVNGDGEGLTSLFLSQETCSVQGLITDDFLNNAVFTNSDGEGVFNETGISESGGICGVLAVAHSLVFKLTVVEEAWSGVKDGNKWDRDFLDKIWRRAGGIKGEGTPTAGEKRAYEGDWNTGWDLDCRGTEEPSGPFLGLFGGTTVEQWCKSFARQANTGEGNEGDDCNFILKSATAGHSMHVREVEFTGGKCKITVTDTGIQGDGGGRNVPLNPGTQVWEVSGTPGSLTIRITGGASQSFWNSQGFTRAQFFCCDEDPIGDGTSSPGSLLQ